MNRCILSFSVVLSVATVAAFTVVSPALAGDCAGCGLNLLEMGGQPGGPNGDVVAEGNFDCNHAGNHCHLTAALVADNPNSGKDACQNASVPNGCDTACEGSFTVKLNTTDPGGTCGTTLELDTTTQAGGGSPTTTTTGWGSAGGGAWPSAGSGNYNLMCGGDGLKISIEIDIRVAGTAGQPGCRNSTQLNEPEIDMDFELKCDPCSPVQ